MRLEMPKFLARGRKRPASRRKDPESNGGGAAVVSDAMGLSLRLMTRFAASEWAEKLKIQEPAQRWVNRGTKEGMRMAEKAASRFKARGAPKDVDRMSAPEAPRLIDLTLTDEQQLTRDTMHRFAEEVLREMAEAADEACAAPQQMLEQSHELGLSMLAVPEAFDGAGEHRSPLSTALIAEDLAWGDMGLAFAALAPVGVVNALVDFGTPEQQAKYLPPFGGETFVPAAMALCEPHPVFDPARLRTRAAKDSVRYNLYGEKCMVPIGETAELFLVAADVLGLGPRMFLVERDAPGLTIEPDHTMGLRSAGLCRLRLDAVPVQPEAMLGEPGVEGFDYAALVDRARIAWGAMSVGCCQAVLDYVIPYCNERKAFGEPITNRQAVAFMIADMAIELEGMRLMVYRAASRAEQGLSFHREAYLARVQCAEKAMKIGTDGVQVLGGHGYVKDHPVERWYRHLRATGIVEGGLQV